MTDLRVYFLRTSLRANKREVGHYMAKAQLAGDLAESYRAELERLKDVVPPSKRRRGLRRRVKRYLVLGLVNSAVAYALYTPYQILWLRLAPDQLVRWFLGGLPFSLAVGWVFAMAFTWVLGRFDEQER